MFIDIQDDFDLQKIADSGQCFRVVKLENGWFRFIDKGDVLYIRKSDGEECAIKTGDVDTATINKPYEISCTQTEWDNKWFEYFDFGRDYSEIRRGIPAKDKYMNNAAKCGEGIRILAQDPWEMLISFIISQRKSIPAIKASVEMICERFGTPIETEFETVYSFPDAEDIINGSGGIELLEDGPLSECKLGYRLKYICEAVRSVYLKEIDLNAIGDLESDFLIDALLKLYGVGIKVANCVSLFAYKRVELAPIDTWIKKVIDDKYDGVNPFPEYGEVAGIMQQFIFYYAQTHKDEF